MTQQPYSSDPHNGGAVPADAGKARTTSLVLGIIGLFFLGIVLGPLAIMQANKAERLGERATAGKVLGWIATIFGILGAIGAVIGFLF